MKSEPNQTTSMLFLSVWVEYHSVYQYKFLYQKFIMNNPLTLRFFTNSRPMTEFGRVTVKNNLDQLSQISQSGLTMKEAGIEHGTQKYVIVRCWNHCIIGPFKFESVNMCTFKFSWCVEADEVLKIKLHHLSNPTYRATQKEKLSLPHNIRWNTQRMISGKWFLKIKFKPFFYLVRQTKEDRSDFSKYFFIWHKGWKSQILKIFKINLQFVE